MTAEQDTLKLMVIIASTRPTRVGGAVGAWIADQVRQAGGWDVTVADLREIDLPLMNEPKHPRFADYQFEHTKRWSAMVAAQDAYIMVFPEYNHSYTAPLKNAIDYLMQEWAHKPVGLVSYGGVSAGLRSAQALKPVLAALRMIPLSEAVSIPAVSEHVQDGVFVPYDSAISSTTTMLEQLHRWSLAMGSLRA